METIALEHIPSSHTVRAALFKNVANAKFLHEQLLARNAEFEYALLDASTVTSRFHLLSAVYKAIAVEVAGELRTPNVHSEIVVAMSSNKNISEAYRRFGISPTAKDVVVVKVLISQNGADADDQLTPDQVDRHLQTNVQGDLVPLSDEELGKTTDWAKLRKYHKLNGLAWLDEKFKGDDEGKRKELELLVVGAMALRGY